MLLASSRRTEILLMFNRKQSFIPDWNTVRLTCSIPSIRVGNYSAATQTRTTYVRRDWVTARVWQDVTGTQTPCPSPVKQCFLFPPYKAFVSYRSQNQTRPHFSSFTETDFLYAQSKYPACWACGGNVSRSDGQMCMCFALSRSFESSVWA